VQVPAELKLPEQQRPKQEEVSASYAVFPCDAGAQGHNVIHPYFIPVKPPPV
jgi:hypothetical protein